MKVENNATSPNSQEKTQSFSSFNVETINSASRDILSGIEKTTSIVEQSLNGGALEVLRETSNATSYAENYLNTGAENIFKSANKFFNDLTNRLNAGAERYSAKIADFGRQFQPDSQNRGLESTKILAEGAGVVSDIHSATQAAGTLSKFTKFGLGALNATTGVLSTAGQFSSDYDNGNKEYGGTMIRATATTAQTLASTYAVSSLVLAAGTGTLAVAALPATVAIGGAIGVGYLADRWINSL